MTQKTLLDEFTMAALTGLISNAAIMAQICNKNTDQIDEITKLAKYAYALGFQMMEERQKYETK